MPKLTIALDDVDHELLDLLQHDSGRTLRELGDLVALSPSAVKRRIDRYHKHGVISRQVTVLDPNRLPAVMLAVCLVTLERESSRHHETFRRRLLAASEVQQIYDVSGDWDYVVMVACSGMAHHTEVADRLFNEAPNVRRYTTLFVLDPILTSGVLPTRPPHT
ncbi:Lrp/AsnC family transcriptional regulator [Plantactinospora soyae]|uniref:DNA-binding Lrp family transcriptional regulator n=1 Tax=Plantactinospora soyae TaxID=1544732 RepID=A0A927MD19_9ACTN|nr:Lrp/AsnC family transcriptional regulator [Plantactinospora soyae]MBE1490896.1 DNA-binding Lrp family transcriptional regulator [Plantactinospora soyae]